MVQSYFYDVDKMLQTSPALQSYFLSTDEPPKILQNFVNDDFGVAFFFKIHLLT